MIRVDNITRKYGDFAAVENVSFEISQGEIVGLLGHNGAGKTTIMKMMTGYLEPTGGTITIDDLDIAEQRADIQKKIGYLPENCPLYPEMSVIDYLDYGAALHGLNEQTRTPLLLEAINKTALIEKATHTIATLSRGYRQRTGVAQAILHKPDILILDEPTNGLDPTQIQHMRSLIIELAKTTTVIISTHILQEVQAICDRVIILKDGEKALDTRLVDLQVNNRLLLTLDVAEEKALGYLQEMEEIAAAKLYAGKQVNISSHTYALTLATTDSQQTAATIASRILEKGWQLYGMHFEERNLETIFAEISAQ